MAFRDQVVQIVLKIPFGKVTTYGTVATMAGKPRGARLVAGIMNSYGDTLPWQRVINRHGFISIKNFDHPKQEQKALLEDEGIEVSDSFLVDLDRYGWFGDPTE